MTYKTLEYIRDLLAKDLADKEIKKKTNELKLLMYQSKGIGAENCEEIKAAYETALHDTLAVQMIIDDFEAVDWHC